MQVETWCGVGTLLSPSAESGDELNLGLGENMGTGVRKTLPLLQLYLIDITNLNEIYPEKVWIWKMHVIYLPHIK